MTSHRSDVSSARFSSSDREPAGQAYASDVLLIADDARVAGGGRSRRPNPRGHGPVQNAAIEPLDMESVVRKLIALLSEDSLP